MKTFTAIFLIALAGFLFYSAISIIPTNAIQQIYQAIIMIQSILLLGFGLVVAFIPAKKKTGESWLSEKSNDELNK